MTAANDEMDWNLIDNQRERAEQLVEGHRRLRDDTEFHLPANKHRRHDQCRDDLDQVVVPSREEAQVAVHRDDSPKVVRQAIDTSQKAGRQSAFPPQEGNRLGVLADVDQVRAESWPPGPIGGSSARSAAGPDRSSPACRSQRTRGRHRIASGLIVQSTPENDKHGECSVHEHQRERQGGGRERANVLGNPLVGVFNRGGLLEMKIRAIREVLPDDSSRQPHPPEQPEPLLGKSVQDRDHRR